MFEFGWKEHTPPVPVDYHHFIPTILSHAFSQIATKWFSILPAFRLDKSYFFFDFEESHFSTSEGIAIDKGSLEIDSWILVYLLGR